MPGGRALDVSIIGVAASRAIHNGACPTHRCSLTMGDACGIGPEILVQFFAGGERPDCLVVGTWRCMRRAGAMVVACGCRWHASTHPPTGRAAAAACRAEADGLPAGPGRAPWAACGPRAGAAAAGCIEAAVQLVLSGEGGAMVTAPMHKEALAAAGIDLPGHTEMLQSLAARGGRRRAAVRMMLANDELRVVLVSDPRSRFGSAVDWSLRARCSRPSGSPTARSAALGPGAAAHRRWPGSIPMPARAACSARGASTSSRRLCRGRAQRRHRCQRPVCAATPSSCARARRRAIRASSTSSSR